MDRAHRLDIAQQQEMKRSVRRPQKLRGCNFIEIHNRLQMRCLALSSGAPCSRIWPSQAHLDRSGRTTAAAA
jgi:hypothetical protein